MEEGVRGWEGGFQCVEGSDRSCIAFKEVR